MASKNTKARAQSYSMLSDTQKNIMKRHYDGGMVGTGRKYHAMITRAVEETDLARERVEKWIGNERNKRRQSGATEQQSKKVKLPPVQRGPNPYNLFCAEIFRTEQCQELSMEGKNRLAATRWRALPEEEKKKFEEVAKTYKHPDVADWSQEEKNKFIARHRRQLLAEIMLLEDVGCHSSVMLVDPCGELFNLGSAEGVNFLITNHDVVAKFRQHFYVQCKRYTYRHVQSLFNKKYSEAIAKPGSRVPYLRGNFTVEGLPPGLVFKKPFYYGAQQCKAIMEAGDAISFVISNEVTTRNENDNPPESNTSSTITVSTIADDSTIASTLRKVASEANIEDVISRSKQLKEEDIDVEDCSLTQDERLTLYTKCRDFFDEDAWTAVGHNSKDISNSAKDLIFPLYTEAQDEDFWLFYSPGKTLSSIDNAKASTKFGGYWLDRKDTGNTYNILTPEDSIKFKWIIKTEHGPLYYEQSLDVNANGEEFELPGLFKDCIRLALQKIGFLRG